MAAHPHLLLSHLHVTHTLTAATRGRVKVTLPVDLSNLSSSRTVCLRQDQEPQHVVHHDHTMAQALEFVTPADLVQHLHVTATPTANEMCCIQQLTVHEATLANVWVATDQQSTGVRVNGRQPAHVLPHLLQVAQAWSLLLHDGAHATL